MNHIRILTLLFALLAMTACPKPKDKEPVLSPGELTLSISQIDFKETSQAKLTLENKGQQSLTWKIKEASNLKWVKTINPENGTLASNR